MSVTERLVLAVEKPLKEAIWGCRMCGQCILHSTGLSCPMRCPKNLRNGPCGGVRADGNCEVYPDKRCVWVDAWEGSRRLPLWRDHIEQLQKPVDWQLQGTSSWINLVNRRDRVAPRVGSRMPSPSRLADLLRDGHFVVTAELSASDSADPEATWRRAEVLRGSVDAINCTDNTGAHVHISSLAAAHLLVEKGLEPIMQLTVRDRNRLALQADLLGAAALGVRNLVLMSGDDVTAGDHPEARRIYDIDSMQLLEVAVGMRDRGTYLSGRKLEQAPSFFIGAVENPFAPPLEFRPLRLQKKVRAGADFIQTQLVFDVSIFARFMKMVGELGLLDKVFIIPSIGIPRSVRGARYMKEKVPGLHVPDALVDRLEKTAPARQADEGVRIAVELVRAVREIPGVSGVHLIGIKWEEGVVRVVEAAGLLPRPTLSPLATVGGRR